MAERVGGRGGGLEFFFIDCLPNNKNARMLRKKRICKNIKLKKMFNQDEGVLIDSNL